MLPSGRAIFKRVRVQSL